MHDEFQLKINFVKTTTSQKLLELKFSDPLYVIIKGLVSHKQQMVYRIFLEPDCGSKFEAKNQLFLNEIRKISSILNFFLHKCSTYSYAPNRHAGTLINFREFFVPTRRLFQAILLY